GDGRASSKLTPAVFTAKSRVPANINRPIASLLLGANTSDNGGISQFYGGASGGNLPTIRSPPAALTTRVVVARRKRILDCVKNEATTLKASLGANEKSKLDAHLDSIRQLENKLNAAAPAGNGCTKPNAPGADSTMQYMSTLDACAANIVHQSIIASA